jgi:hypothetical protein
MIVAINAGIGSGKDEFCKVLQYLMFNKKAGYEPVIDGYLETNWHLLTNQDKAKISGLENCKFADALKDITCRMLGCTREQLEDRDFKNSYLPEEWDRVTIDYMHPEEYERRGMPYGWIQDLDIRGEVQSYSFRKTQRMTYREFMQKLGTEGIRNNVHPNAHVNMLMREYKPMPASDYDSTHYRGEAISFPSGEKYPDWVITDCRFPNEAQVIKDKGGIVVKLIRQTEETTSSKHESETALADWSFDATIYNTGTIEDLVRIGGDFVTYFNLYNYANTNTPITGSVRTFT